MPGQRLFWQGAPVTVSVDSDEAKEEPCSRVSRFYLEHGLKHYWVLV